MLIAQLLSFTALLLLEEFFAWRLQRATEFNTKLFGAYDDARGTTEVSVSTASCRADGTLT